MCGCDNVLMRLLKVETEVVTVASLLIYLVQTLTYTKMPRVVDISLIACQIGEECNFDKRCSGLVPVLVIPQHSL